ncbi:hypothetical protein [Pseudomonas sp. Sample_22]|uniref:hypothetical protein n=1 Tax=Pseudomonas sp. Sample_22 TaxID=2448266 RepID=UPI001033012B|nr:hypothetical protein [Pseudomonas sp. Sample_22]
MTKEQLAAELNGIQYPAHRAITKDQIAAAKAAGLVIVFGASDDLMEFEGAIRDEFGCYNGGTAWVDANGLLDRSQIDDGDDDAIADFVQRRTTAESIQAIWDQDGFSWIYETNIPHATFNVMDSEDSYCRGIVFAVVDLKSQVTP